MSFKRILSRKNADEIRFDSIDDIEDMSLLKEIALNGSNYRMRLKAVSKIYDDEFLKGIVEKDPNRKVKIKAVDNISRQDYMEDISRNNSDCM